LIEFENGFKIYHSGDTCVFGDMKIIAELYEPDLVMLPIGDLFTMSPREAAYACRLLECEEGRSHALRDVSRRLTGTPQELARLVRGIWGPR
jgi:hypothetical protein